MEYQIEGAPLPVVICQLEAGETMLTERGSMSWMTPNMKMETSTNGGLGKAFGRMLSGDSIFQNRYTAQGGQGLIAFASSFPGSIRAFDIGPGRELVVQKSGFLASEAGVQLSVFFQKKLIPVSPWWWIPDIWRPWMPPAPWISRRSRGSRTWCSAVRGSSTPLSPDRAMSISRPCRSLRWQGFCGPSCPQRSDLCIDTKKPDRPLWAVRFFMREKITSRP